MTNKLQWGLVPYTTGTGIEISNTVGTAFPHFTKASAKVPASVKLKSVVDLSLFATESLDFVVSADVLSEISDIRDAISAWLRPLKNYSHLSLLVKLEEVDKVLEELLSVGDLNIQEVTYDDTMVLLVVKKTVGSIKKHDYHTAKPSKSAIVVRFGAFGDQAQAASVYAGLKKQGYHLTLITQNPGAQVIQLDPHLDKIIVLEKDQVPNQALTAYFDYLTTKYDKFVNLCESVEGTLLAMEPRAAYFWPQSARHQIMNKNYVEFQHALAGLPYSKPDIKFYPTKEEIQWAKEERKKFGKVVVMWSMSGSSVHKVNTSFIDILPRVLEKYRDVDFLFVGGPEVNDPDLRAGLTNKRCHFTAGDWTIRQTLTMLSYVDLLFAPETGVANWASMMPLPKIIFLSHSSKENLTRDWVNTVSISTPTEKLKCSPCHMLHFSDRTCTVNEFGVAACQTLMDVDSIWRATQYHLEQLIPTVSSGKNYS